MKRLLEWKQRMLQSPLTRKSSRNASRTETPTNASTDSPVLAPHFDRSKVLAELERQQHVQETPRRVTRKGSNRSRSSPRVNKGFNGGSSSSDEGRSFV